MTNLANVTDKALQEWFDDINVKGWVMTIQGHPVFAIHKGPPGTKLLSEDAYDKHNRSKTAKHLQDLEYKHEYIFVCKSTKSNKYIQRRMIDLYSPADKWQYKDYPTRCRIMEKIGESSILKQAWERCAHQVKIMEVKTDTKKEIAVKYIHGMFDPIYQSSKRKFKLSDDECMQAFEDAIELLKVKMVMNI
jgi:hypothetical protein